MASFSAGVTFTDGVANDVTAAKLAALVNAATPTSGLIQDRTAETVVATNDTFLIGDASDSNNLKSMTVANVMKAELTGTINTTAGTIATLNSTTGTITNLVSTAGTVATLNSTTGTIATLNGTTATIPTLTSITKITSGTGTAAAPAISPTGDTDTGIFFPTANTVAFAEGGTEAMRIDSSGNVGIGTTSPTGKLDVFAATDDGIKVTNGTVSGVMYTTNGTSIGIGTTSNHVVRLFSNNAERARIDTSGNVGIGTVDPITKLHVSGAGTTSGSYTNGDADAQTLYLQDSQGAAGNGGQILFGANQGIFAGIKGFIDNGTGPAGSLILQTRTTTGNVLDRVRISSVGAIGIGGANYGTSGQVLTSGGASAAPSWTTITTTPAAGSVTLTTLSTSATEADNVNDRVAKAWVNFNGTGTVAIRDDFNVSSITDNGTGNYTVNYSAALPNANYAATGLMQFDAVTDDQNGTITIRRGVASPVTTASINVSTGFGSTRADVTIACVAIFCS